MKKKDFSIVLCGKAGQGIQTIENLLVRIMKFSGYNVFSTMEYMSRVRGGTNSTEIRVSSARVSSFVDKIDLMIPLSLEIGDWISGRITPQTVFLGEKRYIDSKHLKSNRVIDLPLSDISGELGSPVFSNVIAAGAVAGIFKCPLHVIEDQVRHLFRGKEETIEKNLCAAAKGALLGRDISAKEDVWLLEKNPQIADDYLINGTEAVSTGL